MNTKQHFFRFMPRSIWFDKNRLLKTVRLPLLLLVLLFSCNTDGLDNQEVSSMALNGFYLEFDQAEEVRWEEGAIGYLVTFESSGEDHKALLDPEGNFLKIIKEISFSELPQAVKDRIGESYSSANRDEAAILEIGQQRYYQVELERFVINDKIIFDESGKVISGISF